ncbi:Hypothetical protein CAP_8507 [Chondromyces apiculatus DSM 436]|uniref:Uncharacterized protein n=1 Tax=Chondromyces apiculatus DSM 436 TaxID=1192034 RepID=A0A017SWA4_9BACT|nr:Hypothetical protein CAP_8507 [Chondromyces apiculatus DSM 436]
MRAELSMRSSNSRYQFQPNRPRSIPQVPSGPIKSPRAPFHA